MKIPVKLRWMNQEKLNIDLQKIKVVVYGLAIMATIIGAQMFINYSFKDEHKMLEAFSNTKSQAIQSQLKVVGDFGNKYMTSEDKKTMIEFIGNQLGITEGIVYSETKGESTSCLTGTKNAENADTNIEVISVDYPKEDGTVETKQYATVTLTIYKDTDSILPYKKMVENIFNQLELSNYDTSITLQGTYDTQLTLDEKNQIANGIIETLQGKVVTEHRGDSLFTIYAYTALVSDFITSKGSRININVAFTYDEYNDKTVIYVASPILNTDY